MGWRIFRPVGTFVCFLSNELIENETEFEEDTLDPLIDLTKASDDI